ncbi:RNA polymerase sigma factor [Streptomyces sp. NPDC001599]|uniref:RNA polymerase sigma factor n=1 Tax=Streptomyces sp. NPDC001599 TaxID=3364591 RepID=UPI0036BE843A
MNDRPIPGSALSAEALMTPSHPACLSCGPEQSDERPPAGAYADPLHWCGSCWRVTSVFARFHLLQEHRITAFVRRRAGHLGGQVVEDVVQETFVEVWKGMDKMRFPERVQYTIARRAIWGRAKEYTEEHVSYDGELPDAPAPEGEVSVEEVIDIERALAELPEKERTYLVDHKMHGHSAEETARRHGVSKGTVTTSAGRGLAKLKNSHWLAAAKFVIRYAGPVIMILEQIMRHL